MTIVRRTTALLLGFCLMAGILMAGPGDSLKVRWINGQKYMLHKVMPKETWSSVSRKYSVTLEGLQKANPGVNVLKIGQIINVPAAPSQQTSIASETQKTPAAVPSAAKKDQKVKYHTVIKGETLYGIARQYGITVAELRNTNALNSGNIAVGQRLKINSASQEVTAVPVETPEPSPKTVSTTITPPPVKKDTQVTVTPANVPVTSSPVNTTVPAQNTSEDVNIEAPGEKVVENGVATWIADSEMNQNKFYALHRTAPIGTIIKVTNRMNNNSVYVKVIGILPSTGDNENILIKITQAAAQRIGALDQRFQAELSYASAIAE
jgi:LysM repeat protein